MATAIPRGIDNADLTVETLWTKGNQEYPNPVILPKKPLTKASKPQRYYPPVELPEDFPEVSVNTLLAMVNKRTNKKEMAKRNKHLKMERPPPLPALKRPAKPMFKLTMLGVKPRVKDPIRKYRQRDAPLLQMFEDGKPVFPNFTNAPAVSQLFYPNEAHPDVQKRVSSWKYDIPYVSEPMVFLSGSEDKSKPTPSRFPKYPTRQVITIRTGIPFPRTNKFQINSFDKPETLQTLCPGLHNYRNIARRCMTDMSEFEDDELLFILQGNQIEIVGVKRWSENQTGVRSREAHECVELPKGVGIDRVHFVRDYRGNLIIEEKWRFS